MNLTVPCSVKIPEMDGTRVKLNVDPGASGPRIILLGLGPEDAALFEPGATYTLAIEKVADAPAAEAQTIGSGDVGDAADVVGS